LIALNLKVSKAKRRSIVLGIVILDYAVHRLKLRSKSYISVLQDLLIETPDVGFKVLLSIFCKVRYRWRVV